MTDSVPVPRQLLADWQKLLSTGQNKQVNYEIDAVLLINPEKESTRSALIYELINRLYATNALVYQYYRTGAIVGVDLNEVFKANQAWTIMNKVGKGDG